jgi:hypothetical protein
MPAPTPVTSPVVDTVAIAVLLLDHTPPEKEGISVADVPAHNDDIPVIDATEFTVKDLVT